MAKIIVVGAGLFGTTVALLAKQAGHVTTVIDSREKNAASPAAGCVMRPSWLTALSTEQKEHGNEVLRQLYGVSELQLATPLGNVKASWVNPDTIWKQREDLDVIHGKVLEVGDGYATTDKGKLRGIVVLAAGVWSAQFVPELQSKMKGIMGCSFIYRAKIDSACLSVWAPYRQAVALPLARNRVWYGDGTAIKEQNWKEEYILRSMGRAKTLFKLDRVSETHVGIRPYVEGCKSGYLRQIYPKLWVSTGGAKNGILLAGSQAYDIVSEI